MLLVPAGLPPRGGDVVVYVKDINQPSLPTPFCSVLMSVSVFKALSTVFRFTNSPDNSPISHSVLSGLICAVLVVPSTVYFFMKVFFSPDIIASG